MKNNPENFVANGAYAIFLKDIKKDFQKAKLYYQKSLEFNSADANNNCNYAGFLFLMNNENEALKYIDNCFQYNHRDNVEAELRFYQYTYVKDNNDLALETLKILLCKGVHSLQFNLQDNVNDAIKKGHPNPEMLQRLADILTKDIPVRDLCD